MAPDKWFILSWISHHNIIKFYQGIYSYMFYSATVVPVFCFLRSVASSFNYSLKEGMHHFLLVLCLVRCLQLSPGPRTFLILWMLAGEVMKACVKFVDSVVYCGYFRSLSSYWLSFHSSESLTIIFTRALLSAYRLSTCFAKFISEFFMALDTIMTRF